MLSTLVYNDYHQGKNVSYELECLFRECNTFDMSVAFIAKSGLAILKETLIYLKEHNIKGRIVTSTYLMFNEPSMFRELLKFDNISVRIYEGDGFHPKGYLFKCDDGYKVLVGSSNLTQNALRNNQEWNVLLNDNNTIDIIKDEFNKQWNKSIILDEKWIDKYSKKYIKPIKHIINNYDIKPNYMQKQALESIQKLRDKGVDKALLESATGTGKTYLSAFDVKRYKPKRMLFVVHLRTIAIKAKETYESLIKDKSMGLFSGNYKETDKDYIFSTIQTISKQENLEMFGKDAFDYIIIDEVHKAGANSYQRLINYFKPKFLLGMSATPTRNDGYDIYELFDHNIAYEIGLKQAMEYDLLCPFHYYGISDLKIDGNTIDDKSSFNLLTSKDRVDYIIDKMEVYGYSGDKVHGLIFVSRKEEANELSKIFNQRGYHTIALTGNNNEEERIKAIESLESEDDDSLDYIFTVDIFNEGVDIPKVNQVLMLRPTQSSIIFIQQLGRGLRKTNNKDYVVIIDFIGNYEKNFLIPIALSDDKSLNKDYLRRFINNSSILIPGCSSVSFDEISKKRIYKSIDDAKFNQIKYIKDNYLQLKHKLGRIPRLKEFKQYGNIDIQRIFENQGSYHEFLTKYDKDYHIIFNDLERKYLKFISTKLSLGKRIQELEVIKQAILKRNNLKAYVEKSLRDSYNIMLNDISYQAITNILTQNFQTGTGSNTYKDITIIDDDWNVSSTFNRLLNNKEFEKQILELLDYSIDNHNNIYSNRYLDSDFCLYRKYTYEDVCRLLNWSKSIVALNIGGYKYDERTNTLPIFINYDKDDNSIKYHDRFINSKTLIAMSKNNLTKNSKGMEIFTKAKERNTTIHIFIRKNKDDKTSKEFYYLGIGFIKDIRQTVMDNKPLCEIEYELDQEVRKDIYDYIIG